MILTNIAIADAYGAGFEFSPKDKIDKYNDLSVYQEHELYQVAGKYTDDTQMSIALAELILSKEHWSPEGIANHFIDTFKRDHRVGYSKGFQALLESCDDGGDLLRAIKPSSIRNGAAMRSSVIAYLGNEKQILNYSKMQAKVTHNTPIGIKSSQAVAMASYLGLSQKGLIENIPEYLESNKLNEWNYQWSGEVSVGAYEACSAAFTCLLNCRSLSELILKCVSLGGDTDTVASIAVGIASCFDEYINDIPSHLIDALDEKEYGLLYLNDLSRRLEHLFKSISNSE